MSACVACGPAMEIARSPDNRVSMNASVITVSATRRPSAKRRMMRRNIACPSANNQSVASDAPRPNRLTKSPLHARAARTSSRVVNRAAIATIGDVNATIPPNYRLRMPGPAAVPERVRAACALPVISHRGAEFRAIWSEGTPSLRRVLGTERDRFLVGTSGTGGMEAALVNVLSPGDALLVVENGQVGERFSAIAT